MQTGFEGALEKRAKPRYGEENVTDAVLLRCCAPRDADAHGAVTRA